MTANIYGFLHDLFNDYSEGGHCDIDGCDFQELLVKHGLAESRLVTEAELAEEWAREYEYEPGDTATMYTADMLAIMQSNCDQRGSSPRLLSCPAEAERDRLKTALRELADAVVESEMWTELEAGCGGSGPVISSYNALCLDLPEEIGEWLKDGEGENDQ